MSALDKMSPCDFNSNLKDSKTELHKELADALIIIDSTKWQKHIDDKNTLLHFAVLLNDLDFFETLTAGFRPEVVNLNKKNKNLDTLLHLIYSHPGRDEETNDFFKLLVSDVRCNINETDKNGDTILHLLCKVGVPYDKMMAIFGRHAQHGDVDFNFKNKKGNTPLHSFAENSHEINKFGKIFLIDQMITRGANAEIKNNCEVNAVMYSIC